MAGVSRAAITKACKTTLADACVDDRVDIDAPCVVEYLARKGVALAPSKRKGKAPRPPEPATEHEHEPDPPSSREPDLEPTPRGVPELDVDGYSDEIAELTVKQVVDRFGTARAYKDWLEAHEKRERARKNYLDNEETEGNLISRELVQAQLFAAIDAVFRRLLQDTPKTVVRRMYAAANSGQSIEDSEGVVSELISSQLRPLKEDIARKLRKPRDPDRPPRDS